MSDQDIFFMKRALKIAEKARGKTGVNPLVGAVVVKNNHIVAEGFHSVLGGEHAEVKALRKLSLKQIRGATLYLTLEPCTHFGRTPPCVDFLADKGLKRIVIAMSDPNPLVNGQGIRKLRASGIKVEVGLLEIQAKKLNEAFLYSIRTKLPFVIVKSACTLDGKIATLNGDSKWISNEKARTYVHQLRTQVDAILTSSRTVFKDDPHLGVRMVKGKDPFRVIIDSKLITPLSAQIYRDQNILVATTSVAPQRNLKKFQQAKIPLLIYDGKNVPLKKLLKDLYKKGIGQILVEAGSGLFTSLLKQKLVQKVYFFVAPKILGEGIPFVANLEIQKIDQALQLQNLEIRKFDDNILFIGNLFT
jgi:diaminohydroxyphosphoribosylaminopyrimidine deaminase/5-amino-6-(5-phosphoribosylamino)uracil reductase